MSYSYKKSKFDVFIEEKYLNIDKKTKILGVGLVALLLIFLFYFLLFQGNYEKNERLTKQVTAANEELKKARKAARNLPVHQKELEEARHLFEMTSTLLPKSQEIPNLLRNISDLGRVSGLDFISFVPTVESPRDFYAEIPIDIQIKGPYHNLGLFLDKVSKLERIVTVNNIKTEKVTQEDNEILLHSNCRLVTYRFTNVKLDPPK
ncbi:type IV pilus inner membrane component PilO [Desulfobulbus oligotrophicus]|jgi:type IV pilus assembly protein PilO|uniref:Type 4a pilus biogenesis protein PilO n=1 Tax=Desulfobulbus oligotrophicus TaxID=1909699 RepID=A0A7T5VBH3_9BACT|nr:type 4a pilus biogenesis protein PilO [Desulfobulbus oligotrophicus]MDY0390539.1 type 4a pilus biogenesis protein PilO [Desulfobulbus oligotrophicus]QQG64830.1 type 4a pilus biogenesis protein PilO [Desulfobulbus oligotrophicus]